MIELNVVGVRIELPTNTPILLLKEGDGERYLPIFIGPFEANAIVLALQGQEPPRPLTHDLLKNVLDEIGASIDYIAITELKESTFFASLRLTLGTTNYEVSSRPSDAVALAVRMGTPIFVTEEVLNEAGIKLPGDEGAEFPIPDEPRGEGQLDRYAEQELERFKEFLDQVSPEDFRSG